MNDAAQARIVGALVFAGYIVGGTGVWLASAATDTDSVLRWLALLSVGALGVVSFLRHAVFHRADALRMGWDQPATSNFQIEVGLANLAWAIVAFVAVGSDAERGALAAVCAVFGLYLVLAGVLHAITLLKGTEQRGRANAVASLVATLAFGFALLYYSLPALVAAAA